MAINRHTVFSSLVVCGILLVASADPSLATTRKQCIQWNPFKREKCEKVVHKKKKKTIILRLEQNHEPPTQQRQLESDYRLKTNIHRVGTTALGLPLYTFEYKRRPGVFEGVMAQDVLKVKPEAVTVGKDGFYRVNYELLGIEMLRLQ